MILERQLARLYIYMYVYTHTGNKINNESRFSQLDRVGYSTASMEVVRFVQEDEGSRETTRRVIERGRGGRRKEGKKTRERERGLRSPFESLGVRF